MNDKVLNDGTNRPDLSLYFMRMARLVATRSTCLRRAVGCVLVDERGHVLSTGYNGVAAGDEHCNKAHKSLLKTRGETPITYKGLVGRVLQPNEEGYDPNAYVKEYVEYPHACEGAFAKSGTQLSLCAAVHAEQNALLQCRDPWAVRTAYVTVAPCDSCLKLFLNTGCRVLVVGGWYYCADGHSNEEAVRGRWNSKERLTLLEERQ